MSHCCSSAVTNQLVRPFNIRNWKVKMPLDQLILRLYVNIGFITRRYWEWLKLWHTMMFTFKYNDKKWTSSSVSSNRFSSLSSGPHAKSWNSSCFLRIYLGLLNFSMPNNKQTWLSVRMVYSDELLQDLPVMADFKGKDFVVISCSGITNTERLQKHKTE